MRTIGGAPSPTLLMKKHVLGRHSVGVVTTSPLVGSYKIMSVFALFCDGNSFVRTGTLLLSDDAAGVSIDLHVTIGLRILHLHNILCQKDSLPLRSRLSIEYLVWW